MKHYEVRDGKKVWPTCPECGCRLQIGNPDLDVPTLLHFGFGPERDARGCICSLINKAWVRSNFEDRGTITLTKFDISLN